MQIHLICFFGGINSDLSVFYEKYLELVGAFIHVKGYYLKLHELR